eukprot:5331537-Lingulodinium_polyedra.AAC.1
MVAAETTVAARNNNDNGGMRGNRHNAATRTQLFNHQTDRPATPLPTTTPTYTITRTNHNRSGPSAAS